MCFKVYTRIWSRNMSNETERKISSIQMKKKKTLLNKKQRRRNRNTLGHGIYMYIEASMLTD